MFGYRLSICGSIFQSITKPKAILSLSLKEILLRIILSVHLNCVGNKNSWVKYRYYNNLKTNLYYQVHFKNSLSALLLCSIGQRHKVLNIYLLCLPQQIVLFIQRDLLRMFFLIWYYRLQLKTRN